MYFDIDEVSDQSSSFPHMLPSAERFADHVGKVRGGGEGREGDSKPEWEGS